MIKVKVYAKVNISLLINGTDAEGYHMLDSVVASANIADVIALQKNDCDEVVLSSGNAVMADKILSLIKRMRTAYSFPCVKVTVQNNIPLGAGLGASSADMAGVIIAADEYFKLGLSEQEKVRLADSTGCDTAFMLKGGCGRIVNRSSVVDRFRMQEKNAVIAVKGFCNTATVFALYDKQPSTLREYDNSVLIRALERGEEVSGISRNALTVPAGTLNPAVFEAIGILGERACMSGSGSSVFAFDARENEVKKLQEAGFAVFPCKIGNFETQVIKE